jgi:hypothetical protein
MEMRETRSDVTAGPTPQVRADHVDHQIRAAGSNGDAIQAAAVPVARVAEPAIASAPATETVGLPEPMVARLMHVEPAEPLWKRWLYLVVAASLAWAFFSFITSFWAPAHAGNNQNGYLATARLLATTGKTGFEPKSPFSFVGWMWVMGDGASTAPGGGMHYAKYPLGLPLVDALVFRATLRLGGSEADAVRNVYLVNPIAMTLAVLGVFFISRLLAGSFAGLLAMILLGTCPLVLILTNNPNSHALSLCCIVWGMYALLKWWGSGAWWLGLIAGFLLGYAVTIRYTEGLLLLPLAIAGLTMIRYRPAWLVQWWRAGVWMLAAAIAVVLRDSLEAPTLEWQRALDRFLGGDLRWWHYAILIGAPLLATVRWNAIKQAFSRDSLFEGEWLRVLGAAAVVFVAVYLAVPQLESSTPKTLHAVRLTALLGFFCGSILLLFGVQWRQPRTWLRPVTLAAGWLLPVAALLIFNKLTVGTWTGYDSTNESTGFTWREFARKWSFAVNQLYDTGLFFILPVAVTGLAMAFRWNWRAALLLTLWFWPGTLLYMAYYYGMNMPLIGYLRFFTSMLPAAVIGAVWLIHRASLQEQTDPNRSGSWRAGGSIAAPIAAGIFVAVAAAMNVHSMLGSMERDFIVTTRLADVSDRVRESVPKGSVVFGDSQRLLNHLQFAGDWDLYGADYFRNGFPVPTMGNTSDGAPNPIQPARRAFLRKAYQGLDNADFGKAQNKIVTDAFASGQRVFVVLESSQWTAFKRAFVPSKQFEAVTVQKWQEPGKMSSDASRSIAAAAAPGIRSTPSTWYIVEIKPRQPTTQPATQPTTQPAK